VTWLVDNMGTGLLVGIAIPVALMALLGVAMVWEAVKVWWEFTHKG